MSLTFLWSARSNAIASCCLGLELRRLRLPPLRLLEARRLVLRLLLRLVLRLPLRLAPLLFERLLLLLERLRVD
jgi:hypothetical protein